MNNSLHRLTTIAGTDLPRLGWQHVARHLPEVLQPVGPPNAIPVKPAGGLWTSPLRFDSDGRVTGTGWTEWCHSGNWGTPEAPVTEIHPEPGARVYVIDGVDDLLRLEDAYRASDGLNATMGIRMWPEIDWPAASTGVDAVWLTEGGQWATRFSQPGLYGWDCETVYWLNAAFTVGDILDIHGGTQ